MPDSSDAIQSATAGVSRCTARRAGSDSRARGQRQRSAEASTAVRIPNVRTARIGMAGDDCLLRDLSDCAAWCDRRRSRRVRDHNLGDLRHHVLRNRPCDAMASPAATAQRSRSSGHCPANCLRTAGAQGSLWPSAHSSGSRRLFRDRYQRHQCGRNVGISADASQKTTACCYFSLQTSSLPSSCSR